METAPTSPLPPNEDVGSDCSDREGATVDQLVRTLLSDARTWADDFAVVKAAPLQALADAVGVTINHDADPPTVLCMRDGLPEALRVERVTFVGMLRDRWATVWCREKSMAIAGSPVPWSTATVFPWVVEVHLRTTELDGAGYGTTAFSVPCRVDPRIPSIEADAAISLATLRAMIHEGQESLVIDGERPLDPHVHGELGVRGMYEKAPQ